MSDFIEGTPDVEVFGICTFRLIRYLKRTFGPNLNKMPEEQLAERVMKAYEYITNQMIKDDELAAELGVTRETISDCLEVMGDEVVDAVVRRLRG